MISKIVYNMPKSNFPKSNFQTFELFEISSQGCVRAASAAPDLGELTWPRVQALAPWGPQGLPRQDGGPPRQVRSCEVIHYRSDEVLWDSPRQVRSLEYWLLPPSLFERKTECHVYLIKIQLMVHNTAEWEFREICDWVQEFPWISCSQGTGVGVSWSSLFISQ